MPGQVLSMNARTDELTHAGGSYLAALAKPDMTVGPRSFGVVNVTWRWRFIGCAPCARTRRLHESLSGDVAEQRSSESKRRNCWRPRERTFTSEEGRAKSIVLEQSIGD
jgi:hypothetical protein